VGSASADPWHTSLVGDESLGIRVFDGETWLVSVLLGFGWNLFQGSPHLPISIVRGHLSVSSPHLTSPTIPLIYPCLYVYSPYLCTISRDHTQRPMTFQKSTHRMLSTSCILLHLYLSHIGRALDALGQVCVTLQYPPPSRGYHLWEAWY
jgi:hypothetical protein